jgi:hypothetical protein
MDATGMAGSRRRAELLGIPGLCRMLSDGGQTDTASATTASSRARSEPATSSASAKRSPRPRSRPRARTPRPTAMPKRLRLRADARVAAAGWSSSRRSKVRALSGRRPRAGSGSILHDRHRPACRRPMPIAIASGCAPDQESVALKRLAGVLQALRLLPTLVCLPSKKLVVFVPAQNNPRNRPPNPHERFVRDTKIPIGRVRPTSPQPPRGFLLGRLSNAGPAPRTTVPQGASVRNPSPKATFRLEAMNRWKAPRSGPS